ncbi:DUF6894 family protein [Mesorhizobium sp. ES1-1]|uniref:DUF6894 family protein n=1 Tax=Mesorhizobium sp. ES1-1 TaxID=2876629 RepID=UPI001CCAEBC3|nr:hypothetical protein [Mesorhizobium sp. ES1-1]MBZ9677625.1 hypothetical protein [Mesorhizobium sp. ES1-1]
MARYYFDYFDSEDVPIPDTDGADLPSFHAAKNEAVKALSGLAGDIRLNGRHRVLQFTIRDDGGRELCLVSLQLEVQPL